MNNSDYKKNFVIASIIFLIFLVLSIIAFIILRHDDTNARYRDRCEDFDQGWTLVTPKGEEDPLLPVKVTTRQNETVTLKKTLPDSIPENYAIMTRNYHQIFEARIDGDLVFSFPNIGWNRTGNIISDEWLLIDLIPEYAGKEIEFSFTNSSMFNFTGYIGAFHYGDNNSVMQHIRSEAVLPFGMGVNMGIIGVLLIIISIIYRKHTNQAPNTAMGAALFFFGMWLTNRAKLPLFSTESNAVYLTSVMGLLMVSPCLFIYAYYRNEEYRKISLRGAQLCFAADVFIVASCFFIPYNIEVLAMACYFMACTALVWNGYLLYSGAYGKSSRNHSSIEILLDKTEFFSNMLFPVASILEVLLYHNMLWTEASLPFRIGALLYSWIYMVFVLWRTFLVVKDRSLVTQRLQESQLELMMGQIQPHFIFNTLSSIRTLIMVDPQIAYNMVYDFSNYLRANVDNVTNLDGIEFASEVSHIKSYVNIEKVRFGDRLDMEYDIQVDNFKVPPLSIQPLVENAIKHGIFQKPSGGTVWLRSYEEEDFNVIEVEDNGVGFNADNASRIFANTDTQGPAMESVKVLASAMDDVMKNLTLLDKDGNPIVLSEPSEKVVNLSGNGSEKHKSTGMLNIFLRLREIGHAQIEIYSKEGEGTKMRVLFPKENTIN
ncbi:MAG: histidine kinase [Firmicutes bacterium]|nr:histidine kinase [Bacillota bacterium]